MITEERLQVMLAAPSKNDVAPLVDEILRQRDVIEEAGKHAGRLQTFCELAQ